MKKVLLFLPLIVIFLVTDASAQLRGDISSPYDYQGNIIDSKSATVQSRLASFFQNNVEFSHSYSMTFSSFGGSYQNLNAYTNTMNIAFNERLQGRVDVSFFHSPFGGNNMYSSNLDQPQVMISNAELNYKISDNANIRFQYRRSPYNSYSLSPFGYRNYNRFDPFYY